MKQSFLWWTMTVALVILVSVAGAQVNWVERGDAGNLPAAAQAVEGNAECQTPVASIQGTFNLAGGDVDMYRICICNPATFRATTVGMTLLDTQLFLFDQSGKGVTFNDESQGTHQSTITGQYVTAPGIYYLAISQFDQDARDSGGREIWNDAPFNTERQPDGPGRNNPVLFWVPNASGGGNYRINLQGTCAAPSFGCDAQLFPDTCFPPPQRGAYTGQFQVQYSTQIRLRNPVLDQFAQCEPLTNTIAVYETEARFRAEISQDDGQSWSQIEAPANVQIRVQFNHVEGNQTFYDTEILELTIQGGTLPSGFQIRESPTQTSSGQMIARPTDDAAWFSSFFDLLTELSADDGQTWLLGDGAKRVCLVGNYAVWNETSNGGGDSGADLDNAQHVTAPGQPCETTLDRITGTLTNGVDADVYAICICDPTNFRASTVEGADFDTQLFLFDENGLGITHNDDKVDGVRQSRLTGQFIPGPGTYYLAVTRWDNDARDAQDQEIWLDDPYDAEHEPDGPGANNPLHHWDETDTSPAGDYILYLEGTCFLATCSPSNGDTDGNGCVDDADLANVIFDFGGAETGLNGHTDGNCDGIVDDADLAEVIFNVGTGC